VLAVAVLDEARLATVTTPVVDGGTLDVVDVGGPSAAERLVRKSLRRRPIAGVDDESGS